MLYEEAYNAKDQPNVAENLVFTLIFSFLFFLSFLFFRMLLRLMMLKLMDVFLFQFKRLLNQGDTFHSANFTNTGWLCGCGQEMIIIGCTLHEN